VLRTALRAAALRTALRAAALRAALDPGDHGGPWEQESRAGQRPAPPERGRNKASRCWPRSPNRKSPRFEGNPGFFTPGRCLGDSGADLLWVSPRSVDTSP